MLSLTEFLWKNVYLFFLIFNDNPFTVNQPPSFSSSSFTVEKSVLIRDASIKDLCRPQTL